MKEIKLLFAGNVGAGKSTAIQTISEIPVINTDVCATDALKERKATTTVALDYGELTLPDGQKLRLYGSPGQARFDYMWDILIEGALGLILLIDNSAEDALEAFDEYLNAFRQRIDESAIVIGITRMDLAPEPALSAYHQRLAQHDLQLPLFSIDARKSEHVVMMIQALLAMLEYG